TMGYSELSLQHVDPAHPLARNLTEIKKAAERAASLTRRLLGFSRQQILFPRILDLNTVIENLNQMLLRTIGEDIALVFKPGIELWQIKADLGQIEQVLMNLIVNARDAMPKGGTIIIETSNVHLDDEYVHSHFSVPPGQYVMLQVSDSGIGMDEQTASRVFEPFFTLRRRDKGRGWGCRRYTESSSKVKDIFGCTANSAGEQPSKCISRAAWGMRSPFPNQCRMWNQEEVSRRSWWWRTMSPCAK
ncbi:MAG: ATP-binding protein, partial [Candidatus Sulfotelmatobacter sp.]